MNKEKRERLEDAKEYVDMNHHQEGGELSKETCDFFSWLISELEQAWRELEYAQEAITLMKGEVFPPVENSDD